MPSGLSLRTGVSASYSPMTPASAMPSTNNSARSQNIAQMAYGINGAGTPSVDGMPAYGAVAAGIAATAILLFLWWSLPR